MTHRVLWLVKGLGRGGAERLLTLMAPRINGPDIEVEVAYLLPWDDALVDDLQRAGVRTHCLDARRTVDIRWVTNLRRLLREGGYDLVHTHSPVPAVAARVLLRDATPVVHTEHNLWERYRWPTYAANASTYGRNAAVLAVSTVVEESIRPPRWVRAHRYPPVQTLLHGVDLEEARLGPEARRIARERLDVAPEAPVIGNVANLTPKKDHATLLEAVDRLRDQYPELIALCIGSGPLADHLDAEVARRRLAGNVRFLGMRDDVLDLLPALDVFVLSSRFEGLPIAMLEAMASEIACVVTSVGGIPEAVAHDVEGLLVSPGDAGELATGILGLLDDPARRRRLGRAARERVQADFSIQRAAYSQLDLYRHLLAAPV